MDYYYYYYFYLQKLLVRVKVKTKYSPMGLTFSQQHEGTWNIATLPQIRCQSITALPPAECRYRYSFIPLGEEGNRGARFLVWQSNAMARHKTGSVALKSDVLIARLSMPPRLQPKGEGKPLLENCCGWRRKVDITVRMPRITSLQWQPAHECHGQLSKGVFSTKIRHAFP